jgi:hypothetical protein
MLKLKHLKCTRFESHYSSCTSRSSENIYCGSGGGAEEKGKTGWNSLSFPPKLMVFWVSPWMLVYFFAGFFFESHRCVWPNSVFWCSGSLTYFKLRGEHLSKISSENQNTVQILISSACKASLQNQIPTASNT